MEKKLIECEVCDGTEFYKDAGFYYCTICNTRTEELKEHVFETDLTQNLKSTKKITKTKEKDDERITSWEAYNYVIISLTRELIKLGARPPFRDVVKALWINYLRKLEVFGSEANAEPKLQVINSKRDAEIVFNLKTPKRKRQRTPSPDIEVDGILTSRQKSRKKRALAQAHYEAAVETKSPQVDSPSLPKRIIFNKYAYKDMRKNSSKKHLENHSESVFGCHKLSSKSVSQSYKRSVHVLSFNKMYGLLYLGLLITNDPIQLGDLLRFIREGHLSINNYWHAFPENYSDELLNIRENGLNCILTHDHLREVTGKLAHFLDVEKYIQLPDLLSLSEKFCNELNLPDQLKKCVQILITKVNPKMKFTKKSTVVPNYEGRVLALIIVVLKILFGIDGKTEYEISKFGERIPDVICFNFIEWLKYIEYRKIVIKEHHFPTQFLEPNIFQRNNLFLNYIQANKKQFYEEKKLTDEMQGYKNLIAKIFSKEATSDISFSPSLTPFRDYAKIIVQYYIKKPSRLLIDQLNKDFTDDKIDFVFDETNFYYLFSEIVHGGANDNFIFSEISNPKTEKQLIRRQDLQYVDVILNGSGEDRKDKIFQIKESNSQLILKNHKIDNYESFEKINKQIRKIRKTKGLETEVKTLPNVYNFCETYWTNWMMNSNWVGESDFREFFDKYPENFKKVLEECARIGEFSIQDFYSEFQLTETYVVDFFKDCEKKTEKKYNNLILQAKKNW